ncbi:MAG: protein-L-isoaspartate(D-aspartate) O-methyltransferase [Chloroflexota bacterium]
MHDCGWLLTLLRGEGVSDARILEAIRQVPRERFVPPHMLGRAYENEALPVGEGQTISQPTVVASMTQALALNGTERVLEVGTGTGYQTAILARLAAEIVSIERIPSLARSAAERLRGLGVYNVEVHVGDGTLGYAARAPYDAIVVTAGGPRVPPALAAQLAVNPPGRLVIPVGPPDEQQLLLLSGDPHSRALRRLGPVRFVPLIGNQGWETPR